MKTLRHAILNYNCVMVFHLNYQVTQKDGLRSWFVQFFINVTD